MQADIIAQKLHKSLASLCMRAHNLMGNARAAHAAREYLFASGTCSSRRWPHRMKAALRAKRVTPNSLSARMRTTAQHRARSAGSLTAATAEARRSRGVRHHDPVAQACGWLSYSWVAGTAWRVSERERRARASDGQCRLAGPGTSAVRDRSFLFPLPSSFSFLPCTVMTTVRSEQLENANAPFRLYCIGDCAHRFQQSHIHVTPFPKKK